MILSKIICPDIFFLSLSGPYICIRLSTTDILVAQIFNLLTATGLSANKITFTSGRSICAGTLMGCGISVVCEYENKHAGSCIAG